MAFPVTPKFVPISDDFCTKQVQSLIIGTKLVLTSRKIGTHTFRSTSACPENLSFSEDTFVSYAFAPSTG